MKVNEYAQAHNVDRRSDQARRPSQRPTRRPAKTGTAGLAAEHYTDEAILTAERRSVFARGWTALCREDEVPVAGSFLATHLHEEPVVVVRDRGGKVRVLSNVCRHRGMLLAEGSGVSRRLSCPYHAWAYDLDGRLIGAPLMREWVDFDACALTQFQTWCWGGFVFANPSANAKPPVLRRLDQSIAPYAMDGFHLIDVFEEEWPCNWKCLVENFMDAYHLSVVHPETLHPLTPSALSRIDVSGKHFTSYTAHYAKTAPARKRGSAALSDDERKQSRLFCVYPSMVASVSADTLAFLMLQPASADRVRVRWGLSSFEAKLSARERRERVSKWQDINAEDHAVLARLQQGLQSAMYKPGPLAPPDLEGCISEFHRWYRDALQA